VGVTTPKNIIPITIGETIFPKRKPNFIHNLFRGVKIFEFINPKIKNINETAIDQNLKLSPFKSGHNAMIKKTTKKTIPKLLLDGNLKFFINFLLSINFFAKK